MKSNFLDKNKKKFLKSTHTESSIMKERTEKTLDKTEKTNDE